MWNGKGSGFIALCARIGNHIESLCVQGGNEEGDDLKYYNVDDFSASEWGRNTIADSMSKTMHGPARDLVVRTK